VNGALSGIDPCNDDTPLAIGHRQVAVRPVRTGPA
jgi:hypothetical protein